MVGLAVCIVYRVIKFPIRVIEPAKRNRVPDSSVGYPGTRHGPTKYRVKFYDYYCKVVEWDIMQLVCFAGYFLNFSFKIITITW